MNITSKILGDIGSNGASKISTPNIDRIAAQGLRFTNAYATAANVRHHVE